MDFLVQIINFLNIVIIGKREWLRAVIVKPGQGWGLHEGCYGTCVRGFWMVFSPYILDKFDEMLKTFHDEGPAVLVLQVVIASHHNHIKGFGVLKQFIVQPEGMDQVLDVGLLDGDVVHMHHVSNIL